MKLDKISSNLKKIEDFRVSSNQEEQIDFIKFLSIIWEEKWIFILVFVLSLFAGVFIVSQSTNQYASYGKVILDNHEENFIDFASPISAISSDNEELNSQIEIIKSRNVISRVVDQNKLYEDPEFVSSLNTKNSILSSAKDVILKPMTFATEMISKIFDNDKRIEGEAKINSTRDEAITALTNRLSVEVIPSTFVFKISIETQSPEKSANIINNVAKIYIDREIALKIQRTNYAALWLAEKIDILRKTVEETESLVADYQKGMERGVSDEDILVFNRNLQNARGRLSTLKDQFNVENQINDLDRARLQDAERTVMELEEIVGRQFDSALKLRQLRREAESASAIYEYFLNRFNEIEIQKGVQQASVSILSDAVPNYEPVRPRRLLILFISVFSGMALASVFVVVRRALDQTFKDPVDLKDAFEVPALGFIPIAPVKSRRRLLEYAEKHPSSQFMESFRTLRTSLLANGLLEDRGSVLMTTSSIPGEGKTTCAVMLAIVTAVLNKKVLLIECDLRRMVLESYFPKQSKAGLISSLNDNSCISNIINITNIKNVHVIHGERSNLNPADVFSTDVFGKFISSIKSNYDLVILDAPPVLPVPDARLIAKHTDCIVYSIKAGKTPESIVRAGIDSFQDYGVEISGLSLTQVKKSMKYAGYKIGYGYGGEYYRDK